jgi:hypothetical protein
MKIYKIHLDENPEIVQLEESEVIDEEDDVALQEFAERISGPFVALLKQRIVARESKNYDKDILTKEIGVVD